MDPAEAVPSCPECGAEIPPGFLSCPGCRRLVHAEDLKSLAAEAEEAERAGDLARALGAWRSALERLPRDSRQFEAVFGKVNALSRRVDVPPAPAGAKGSRWGQGALGAGIVALISGLTKLSTFLSMFLAFGVYWSLWGWKFALGLVLSMYVHEMGHVVMLRRYGIRATAPMFIPGLGAYVRLNQYPTNPREDSRVGLAGPMWGLGAAVAAYGIYLATDSGIWGAIARIGAWLNLFNLIPIWQLDGGRGFRSLTLPHRWLAALTIGGMYTLSREGMLVMLLVFAVLQGFDRDAPKEPDAMGLIQYMFLIIALSALCMAKVPGMP